MGPTEFHRRGKYNESHWCPSTVWLLRFFKMSYFVFRIRKYLIQVWNNLKVRK